MARVGPDEARLQWIQSNLQIITKDGHRVRLIPNVVQLRLHLAMQEQRVRGLPARIRLLKARQFGCSTWAAAEAFYEVHHNPNWNAMAISVDSDSTDHIFRMTRMFNEMLPPDEQLQVDNTNRKEIIFSRPHFSRFVSQTAGKMSLGRSFTAQFCHTSELAFWERAEVQVSGLEEIIPMRPGTTIIQETTANGQGGYFYNGFMDDLKRRRRDPNDYNGYLPVFFPWYVFPEYAIEPVAGAIFTSAERAMQRQYQLSDAQLYWWHLKLESKNGDLSLMEQEYPSSVVGAFQTSGNPVYSAEIVATQAMYLGHQFERILFEEKSGSVTAVPVEELGNIWLINARPRDGHDYAIGIDTMEGRISDVKNPKSNLDFDAIVVLDRNTGEVAAVYHGRGDQAELARQAFRAAVWYNEAYVAPEIPQSMILLNYFKERGYPYIYNRQRHEDRMSEGESEVLGWRTTAITRKWLVDDFVVALKEASVRLVFPELVEEMRGFVRDKNGRPGHLPGEHDDLLFAAMIAFQVHKRCPLATKQYESNYTGSDDESGEKDETLNSLAVVGAFDDEPLGDDDDDAWGSLYTE